MRGDKMPAEKTGLQDLARDRPDTRGSDQANLQAALTDRGLVTVKGASARDFLQGLVSNDVRSLAVGQACYAALLTPQGKIVCDFLVLARSSDELFLDCPKLLAADLTRRLTFYKLRAKVEIADRTPDVAILAAWGNDTRPPDPRFYRDPRDGRLGWRAVFGPDFSAAATNGWAARADGYDDHRIRLRIPHGGADFTYSDTFPHDANVDLLHGIDFNKGCYIGQEVVARVHHRGNWRKRVARIFFTGLAPPSGTSVRAGEATIGVTGSSTIGQGLAMLRIDKANEALAAGQNITAGDSPLTVELAF
jgi:folate-binding protein YgfZ